MDIRRRIAPQTPSNPVEASGFVVGIRWTGRLGSIIPGRAALFRPAGSLQSVKKLTECSLWLGVCLTETAKTEGRATDLGNVGSVGSLRFTFGDFVNGDDSAERGFGK